MTANADPSKAYQALLSLFLELFPWIPDQEEYIDPLHEWRTQMLATPIPDAVLGTSSDIDERIMNPMRGFHKGYLDLEGRHSERYSRICASALKLARVYREVPALLERLDAGEDSKEFMEQIPLWCYERKGLTFVSQCLAEYSVYIETHAKVYFQKLTLSDLPVELLHLILQYCDAYSARRLRLMSRAFAELCRPYAHREYFLEYPSARIRLFRRKYRIFLNKCKLLLEDQELARNLRDLSISIGRVKSRPAADLFQGHWDAPSLCKSLSTHLSCILLRADNLERLVLASVYLDVVVMERILKLPKLRTLEIELCDMPDEDWTPAWVECLSALNLIITTTTVDRHVDSNVNMFLIHMPSLRYFSHYGSLIDSHILFEPGEEYTASGASSQALTTMERLEISNPLLDELPRLSTWFTEARLCDPNNVLHLTHLKLFCQDGIALEDCRQIVDALRGSPIRCLRLQGPRAINPAFLSFLADAFPELEDLTLEYRKLGHGMAIRATEWPDIAQAYAPEFVAFAKLRSFSWNYRLECTYTNAPVILAFEEGWEPFVGTGEGILGDPFRDPCSWIDEWISMFRMFAAYCPSLETLEFMRRVVLQREEDGDITWETDDMMEKEPRCLSPLPTF